jgi:hypothetical protein
MEGLVRWENHGTKCEIDCWQAMELIGRKYRFLAGLPKGTCTEDHWKDTSY